MQFLPGLIWFPALQRRDCKGKQDGGRAAVYSLAVNDDTGDSKWSRVEKEQVLRYIRPSHDFIALDESIREWS